MCVGARFETMENASSYERAFQMMRAFHDMATRSKIWRNVSRCSKIRSKLQGSCGGPFQDWGLFEGSKVRFQTPGICRNMKTSFKI